MSAGLLLITHDGLGAALLQTAAYMLGAPAERAEALAVDSDRALRELDTEARALATRLDSGGGVLVLTDLVGATPGNVAARLSDRERVQVVCGLNLPMLLKSLNYRHLPLDELAEKAVQGGREGIMALPHAAGGRPGAGRE